MKLFKFALIGAIAFICIPGFATNMNYFVATYGKYNTHAAEDYCHRRHVDVYLCSNNFKHCTRLSSVYGYYQKWDTKEYNSQFDNHSSKTLGGEVCVSESGFNPSSDPGNEICAYSQDLSNPMQIWVSIDKKVRSFNLDQCRYEITIKQVGTYLVSHYDLDFYPGL